MKGLELAESYFNTYGLEMLKTQFGDRMDRIAAGLVGDGSECYGYDDATSTDHDFEPGFCLWLDEADEREFGFKLERAYAKLPKEFMGFRRQPLSPCGGNRHGVLITEDFYRRYLGIPRAPESAEEWLRIPAHYLATATNGAIFHGGTGNFIAIRNTLLNGYPEDVRRKKLAAHLALMGQAGQYNYTRCLKHGERGGAQLALFEFVQHALQAIYHLNHRYCPFYKWAFRGMRDLPALGELEPSLVFLIESPNDDDTAPVKAEMVEDIAAMLIAELKNQRLSDATCNNLETHAYSLTDKIVDPYLRNLHVMDGV